MLVLTEVADEVEVLDTQIIIDFDVADNDKMDDADRPADMPDDEEVDIVANDVMPEVDDVDIEAVYLELMFGMALEEVVDVVEVIVMLEFVVVEADEILVILDEMLQPTEVDDEVEVDVDIVVVLDADTNEYL